MQGKYLVTTEKIIFMRFENLGLKSIEKEISLKPTFMPMPLDIVIHSILSLIRDFIIPYIRYKSLHGT